MPEVHEKDAGSDGPRKHAPVVYVSDETVGGYIEEAVRLAGAATRKMEKTISDVRRLAPVLKASLGKLEDTAGMKHENETYECRTETVVPSPETTDNKQPEGRFIDDRPVADIISEMSMALLSAVNRLESDIESVVNAGSRMNEIYESVERLLDLTDSKIPPKTKDPDACEMDTSSENSGKTEPVNAESLPVPSGVEKVGRKKGLPFLPPGFKHSGGRGGGRPSLDIINLFRGVMAMKGSGSGYNDFLAASRAFQSYVSKVLGKPWEILTPDERENVARMLLAEMEKKETENIESNTAVPQQTHTAKIK